ncbi:hypothetical protein IFM89_015815 [Coptis chinensis]|uniref:ZW10 C-terminal helical domain-containing protein n=1 Tax=Coptis chinensis TaxID=261450 RepID=A0A835M621_9MAGN|nr:hypothetical protein IFM89_015815 [Coptis chinensis]
MKKAIDGADGFQNTHQMQQYECTKLSIEQIVFTLEKVQMIWEPLLLPSTYKRSMCAILDFVLFRILEDILFLDDMAAEETLQVQRLIHSPCCGTEGGAECGTEGDPCNGISSTDTTDY